MNLTPTQIKNTTDLWMGKLPTRAIIPERQIGLGSPIVEINRKGKKLFVYTNKEGEIFRIEKNTFELLLAMRRRHFERYARGDGGLDTCFNFLGGVKDGILQAVVPISHKKGCMFFSPVEPSNFVEPMYELQVNGYIPKVLVRFMLYTVKDEAMSRVHEMANKNKQKMTILSLGHDGVRAEDCSGNMCIEIV